MPFHQTCPNCGDYDEALTGIDVIICPRCGYVIPTTTEHVSIGWKLNQPDNKPVPEVLEKGTVVKLDNADHVWHDEIALICDSKHKFYRLELNGSKIWVPCEWVKKYELN